MTPQAIMTPNNQELVAALEPLLSLQEAARIIRRSHWSLRKYIAEGRIRGVRIGRDLLVEPCELRRFIAEARD